MVERFPISDVVRDITGHSVLPINRNNILHQQIVNSLKKTLDTILAQDNIFYARRPNDVSDNTKGECFEDRIVRHFNSSAQNMLAKRLVEKGYPNITIRDIENNVLAYIEVKITSTARTSESSARDFYISPGSIRRCKVIVQSYIIQYTFEIEPGFTSRKIEADAPHLLILGVVENLGISSKYNGYNDWKLVRYKLYDLANLNLKMKIEFNANYRDIEKECNLL